LYLIDARKVEHIETHYVPFIVSPNVEDLTAGAGFPPNTSPVLRAGEKDNACPVRTAVLIILDTVNISK
jgi:hypothetical protein